MNRAGCLSPRLRWLCWVLAPAVLFVPFLLARANFSGNWDTLFYGNVLAITNEALKSGDLFPHWLATANAGFGSPVMLFYAPLAYILTALVNLPLAPLRLGIDTQLVTGMYASQIISGFTAYLWLKRSFPERVAFVGSVLFVLLPYKFTYIYDHHNLSQLWSLAFLPLWMIAAEKLVSGDSRATGLYALIFALVYYIHSLSIIAFGAVPAAYALWFGRRSWRTNYPKLLLAHVLGIGMCLVYVLPQRDYRQWVNEQWFWSGPYDWRVNLYHIDIFLCAYYGIIALAVAYAAKRCRALATVAGVSLFWAGVIGAVAFMTLPMSAFIWERISVLKYLQFPAGRLHSAAFMGAIYLICVWLNFYKDMQALGPLAYRRATLWALIAAFAVFNAWRCESFFTHPVMQQTEMDDVRKAEIILPLQYQTKWGCIPPGTALTLYRMGQIPAPVTSSRDAIISDVIWQPPEHIGFSANASSGTATAWVRQCYFPLWRATDESGHDIAVSADSKSGVVSLMLPKGAHRIEVTFTSPPSQKTAYLIASLSLLISLLLGVPPLKFLIYRKGGLP